MKRKVAVTFLALTLPWRLCGPNGACRPARSRRQAMRPRQEPTARRRPEGRDVRRGRAYDRARPLASPRSSGSTGAGRPTRARDERVFVSPQRGTPFDAQRYAATFRQALERAGIGRPMRPFYDARHTAITNAAAAGTPPEALMAWAGHPDCATTPIYIDLSGERSGPRRSGRNARFRRFAYKRRVQSGRFVGTRDNGLTEQTTGKAARLRRVSSERSGAGVEPTQPGATRPHRF